MKIGFIGFGNVGSKLAGSLNRGKTKNLSNRDHPVALERLVSAGGRVEKTSKRAYLPRNLIEQVLKTDFL